MNCIVTAATYTNTEEGDIQNYTKVKIDDPIYSKYKLADIKEGYRLYGYTTSSLSGKHIFAVYKVIFAGKKGFNSIIKLKRVNAIDESLGDNNILDASAGAFACDNVNYVDDMPGSNAGLNATLVEQARTYNLLHMPKAYVDVINVEDIITDPSATEQNKKHYIELKYTPLQEELVYMEINGVNYYEQADDMEIDRENRRIYFDTQDDDFTFEDLKNSVSTIRVFYHYLDE